MEKPFRKHDEREARWAQIFSSERMMNILRIAENILSDSKRDDRFKVHECKPCFYSGKGMAGAAMTRWYCGICAKPGMSGSTHTPKLCVECARKHDLCSECGADIDLRAKRRKFDFGKNEMKSEEKKGE